MSTPNLRNIAAPIIEGTHLINDTTIGVTNMLAGATSTVNGMTSGITDHLAGLTGLSAHLTDTISDITNKPNTMLNSVTNTLGQTTDIMANASNAVTSGLSAVTNISSSINNTIASTFNAVDNISSILSNPQGTLSHFITEPFPTPAPIQPIRATPFQVSPYLEKVLVNPYETHELNVLSEAQLAVDDVVDYLESLLPTDLLDTLKKLPDLIDWLVDKGMMLEDLIGQVLDVLDTVDDLIYLFRNNPIMDIFNSFSSFGQATTRFGIPGRQRTNIFNHAAFNYIADTNWYYGVSQLDVGNMAMYVGRAASNINVDSTVSTITTDKDILLLAKSTSALKFNVLCTSINKLGNDNSTMLINTNNTTLLNNVQSVGEALPVHTAILNSYETVGKPTTSKYIDSLNTSKSATLAVMDSIPRYGLDAVAALAQVILNNAISAINLIISVIEALSPLEVTNELTAIKASDIVTYRLTHTDSRYTDLYNVVEAYGIDTVICINNILKVDTVDNLNKLILNIKLLTHTNDLLVSVTANTYSTVSNLITELSKFNNVDLVNTSNKITELGNTLARVIVDSINTLTLNPLIYTLLIALGLDKTELLSFIASVLKLSDADISNITKIIATNEPSSLLLAANVSGILNDLAFKKLLEAAAKSGSVKAVVDLVVNYKGYLSISYRTYIITTLLQNYKMNKDDVILGLDKTADLLIEQLNLINPVWYLEKLNNVVVYNQVPFISSSSDALKVLLHHPNTLVPTLLQQDNHY